jgi:hypothetical protein
MINGMQDQTEYNKILDSLIDGNKKIRDVSSFEFCQFVLKHLSNVRIDNYEIVKLTKLVNNWNTEYTMSADMRVDIVLQLQKLGL